MQNNSCTSNHVARWFLPVCLVLLVWNLLGVMAFIQQLSMTPEQINALPALEQALYQNIPLWVTIAFASAVLGGTFGCMALALKKSLATPLLWISLFGVIAQLYHSFFISDAMKVYGITGLIMPIVVLLIAICLVVLSWFATQRNWLS
jgi:hypothetical protein